MAIIVGWSTAVDRMDWQVRIRTPNVQFASGGLVFMSPDTEATRYSEGHPMLVIQRDASTFATEVRKRHEAAARRITGHAIRIWGVVDQASLYGDRGAREILGEWWSREASNPAAWRFNLKANPDDKAGHSFAVHVRNDADSHQ